MSINSPESGTNQQNDEFQPAFQLSGEEAGTAEEAKVDFEIPREVVADGQTYTTRTISEIRTDLPPALTHINTSGERHVVVFNKEKRLFQQYNYGKNGEYRGNYLKLNIHDARVRALKDAYPYYDFDNSCIKEGY